MKKHENTSPFLSLYLTLLFIAFIVHFFNEGAYISRSNEDKSTYWIGAMGTTIPFLVLAFITAMDILNGWNRNQSQWLPCFGFLFGWFSMMTLTLWIVNQEPYSGTSSTMGVAVMLTPVVYIVLFPIPYLSGRLLCSLILRWLKSRKCISK